MNWFPSPPPFRGNKNKNCNQLARVQKRTQHFKSGDVQRKKELRVRAEVPSIPNQANLRLDALQSTSTLVSVTPVTPCPPIVNFLDVIAKMNADSSTQRDELVKEAAATGNPLPRICIDRGVLTSECCLEDNKVSHLNLDFIPSAVIVTRSRGDEQRSVSIKEMTSEFGMKQVKEFAKSSPFSFGGLKTSQIDKIVRNSHSAFKKQRMKAKATEQEDLARKAQNISISSESNVVAEAGETSSTDFPNNNLEGMDISQIIQGGVSAPEMNLTFHSNTLPESSRDQDDTMEINDLTEFD
jgi:hypothetical protein